MTDTKVFPLEKILTVSLGDYLDILRENNPARNTGFPTVLASYNLVGVHVETGEINYNLIELFAQQVPSNAEVVVDYQTSLSSTMRGSLYPKIASGTALVPKQ